MPWCIWCHVVNRAQRWQLGISNILLDLLSHTGQPGLCKIRVMKRNFGLWSCIILHILYIILYHIHIMYTYTQWVLGLLMSEQLDSTPSWKPSISWHPFFIFHMLRSHQTKKRGATGTLLTWVGFFLASLVTLDFRHMANELTRSSQARVNPRSSLFPTCNTQNRTFELFGFPFCKRVGLWVYLEAWKGISDWFNTVWKAPCSNALPDLACLFNVLLFGVPSFFYSTSQTPYFLHVPHSGPVKASLLWGG